MTARIILFPHHRRTASQREIDEIFGQKPAQPPTHSAVAPSERANAFRHRQVYRTATRAELWQAAWRLFHARRRGGDS